jgi:hypothetical protein
MSRQGDKQWLRKQLAVRSMVRAQQGDRQWTVSNRQWITDNKVLTIGNTSWEIGTQQGAIGYRQGVEKSICGEVPNRKGRSVNGEWLVGNGWGGNNGGSMRSGYEQWGPLECGVGEER